MGLSLKREFLELLEKDKEFRYTVAGYLGLSEVLKRLDSMEASMVRLGEEQKGLREDFNKMLEMMNERFERVDKRFERVEKGLNILEVGGK